MRKVLGAVVLGLLVNVAAAQVVFNNFAAGSPYYNVGTGWTVGTASGWLPANIFKPSASGNLDYIELAVTYVTPAGAKVNVRLWDSAGGVPTTQLEQWLNITPLGQFGTEFWPPLKLTSVAKPLLSNANDYAVSVEIVNPGEWSVWNQNNTGDNGPRAYKTGGGPWTPTSGTRGAMRVVIPEPATLGLLALSVLALRRR